MTAHCRPSQEQLELGRWHRPPIASAKHHLLDPPLMLVDFFRFNSLSQIECYCHTCKLLFVRTMFGAMENEMAWLYSVATNIKKVK